jgi:hypothetical protein
MAKKPLKDSLSKPAPPSHLAGRDGAAPSTSSDGAFGERGAARGGAAPRKECKQCGESFEAIRSTRKFCSDSCKMQSYRRRKNPEVGSREVVGRVSEVLNAEVSEPVDLEGYEIGVTENVRAAGRPRRTGQIPGVAPPRQTPNYTRTLDKLIARADRDPLEVSGRAFSIVTEHVRRLADEGNTELALARWRYLLEDDPELDSWHRLCLIVPALRAAMMSNVLSVTLPTSESVNRLQAAYTPFKNWKEHMLLEERIDKLEARLSEQSRAEHEELIRLLFAFRHGETPVEAWEQLLSEDEAPLA